MKGLLWELIFLFFQHFGETPDQKTQCGACKEPKEEVSVRCLDCNLVLCDPCHKSHDSFQPMQNHQTVSVKEASKQSLVPVSTSADQICGEHDGEAKRFYCETCGKPVCRDCIVMKQYCRDHEYMSLKDASRKQAARLVELTKQCEKLHTECQEALQKTEEVEKNFECAVKNEKEKADRIKKEYMSQVESMFANYDTELNSLEEQEASKLNGIKEKIQTSMVKIKKACDLSTNVTQMGSFFDITTMYSQLSTSLEEVSRTTIPVADDEILGKFYPPMLAKLEFPEQWKLLEQFSTMPYLENPQGIAVNKDRKIALTDYHRRAGIVSMNGRPKYRMLKGPFSAWLYDIAILPNHDIYLLPGLNEILFYDNQGVIYYRMITKNHNGTPSWVKTITVDSNDKIIAGLMRNSIAIYESSMGHVTFGISSEPRFLAVTYREEIIVTTHERDGVAIQIMDYNGNNKRNITPPNIKKWKPTGVCCSKQGEIYVANSGTPCGIYKFTVDGRQCLGSVITGLDNPQGIAITDDGQQLLVTEFAQNLVKIFQRF